jgi:CDP-glucose 4,6-dehydratase
VEGVAMIKKNSPFKDLYRNKRVLVTGHTGFKGSWVTLWLLQLGAKVAGFSAYLPSEPCNFEISGLRQLVEHYEGDVRNFHELKQVFNDFQPQIVFHLAAQPIVRRAYDEPKLTFDTNLGGTVNILECIRQSECVQVAVIITSDKCYKNVEWIWGYRENDQLGGDDPYSASKGCAEIAINSYYQCYFNRGKRVNIASARAGNVMGGGDWAQDRIVPDCLRAWSEGHELIVRNPHATRPWQHVMEPISGYLWLGTMLWEGEISIQGEAFNFGPSANVNQSVEELISTMSEYWPRAAWQIEPTKHREQKESTLLMLCCDKALNLLKWRSILSFFETIRLTSEWYRTYYEKGTAPMCDLTCQQIEEYTAKAAAEGLKWTT